MKHTLLKLSLNLVKLALRLYGWRDAKRPAGFPPSRERPFWRWHDDARSHIESASFAEAINHCIKDARGKTLPHNHHKP